MASFVLTVYHLAFRNECQLARPFVFLLILIKEIAGLSSTASRTIIDHMKSAFDRIMVPNIRLKHFLSLPERISSDISPAALTTLRVTERYDVYGPNHQTALEQG